MKKQIAAGIIALGLIFGATACSSDKDVASENLSKEADSFNVQREIRGINTRTGEYLFQVTGRCAIDREAQDYVITCKQGPNDYRKHFISRSNDTSIVTAQLDGIDVSVYHTKIIIKPENLLPEIDLQAGKQ